MSNKEDFRRQVDQVDKNAKETIKEASRRDGLKKRKIKLEQLLLTWEKKEGAKEKELQQNQEVVLLDSNLEIKERVKTLKEKIKPLTRLKKYGPKGGELAYAFIYNKFIESGNNPILPGPMGTTIGGEFFYRKYKEVLAVKFNNLGGLKVYNISLRDNKDYKESMNPLKKEWKEADSICDVDVTSVRGDEQFSQTLINFLVEVKLGKGNN